MNYFPRNSTGRTSLARQGDSVGVCTNPQSGSPDGSSTTANCAKTLLPDHPSRDNTNGQQSFYSIPELAVRWRCSRGTVYNRLRFAGAKVLDFATEGRKGKKLVPALTIFQIESKHLKAMP